MGRHSRRHRSRKMSGGSYTDGASYGMYVNGTGGSQWARTMDQGGPYGQVQGNVIIGAQGQNVTPATQMPNSGNLNLIQSGAGRRRRRGGFLGEVINQAVVPFSLLGAQQTYRKRKGGKTHKRRGGFVGEVINQAVVPFALLGAQQNYGRKRRAGKTRRHRRH